jgi:hypothetical protein
MSSDISAKLKALAKDMNEFTDKLEISKRAEEINIVHARQMKQALGVALAGLETLSRLGNGEHKGNSEGNTIAQDTLDRISAIFEPKEEHEQPGGGGL